MPIRMEKDDPRPSGQDPRRPNRNENNGGGLGRLLPFILLFVLKRPKLILPLLIIGGLWYFFFYDGGNAITTYNNEDQTTFSFGATLDQEQYDKAKVFPALASGSTQLPSSVSLQQYVPRRMQQGRQGSCVGWASSYAGRTILEAMRTGQKPDDIAFSPSFVYNQIALSGCQGAYMRDAMETLRQAGSVPFSIFPYNENSCSKQPDNRERSLASQFRIKGYNRLTLDGDNYTPDLQAIKEHLAQGAPVIIGMQVGGTFMHEMVGKKVWHPTRRDYSQYGFSGHAMCVIGYDDKLAGGAFQIMNSWGPSWGQNGIAWVPYDAFQTFVKEAYGLYPMGNGPQYDPNSLSVQFGLLENRTQKLLPLRQVGNNIFRTQYPIKPGDKFKIAITNSVECYTYIFGEETDGSSYVLFPYTPKHDAYCGITGTRIFPRDYSLTADELGQRDRIAIVISKKELDFERLNALINQSSGSSYAEKFNAVLSPLQIPGVDFKAGEAISFETTTKGKDLVSIIIELDKN